MEASDKENIDQIKNSLRKRLQQTGVNSLIRHMVRDICSSATARGDSSKIGPDEVVQELYTRGLMKTVLDNVQWSDNFERELVEEKIQSTINEQDKKTTAPSKIHVIDEEEDDDNDNVKNSRAGGDEVNSENTFLSCDDDDDTMSNKSNTTNYPEIIQEIPHDTRVKGRLNGKYYLKFEILKGRSFLDQLFDTSNENPKENKKDKSTFVLHICYKAQRFYTKPTVCQCEPKFQDTCMINLGYFEDGTVLQLLTNYEPIRIILLQDCVDGERKVLSYTSFDWRSLLMSNECSEKFPISLMGIGPESQVPVGIINTKLTILPILQEILSASTYAAQINAERSIVDERERLFLIYVKQWWRDFIEIRSQHSKRLVKIFSYDENNMARPVQTFVKPIAVDRLLLTPFQAAWFVSLISLRGNGSDDLYQMNFPGFSKPGKILEACQLSTHTPQVLCDHWQSLITTITAKSGRVEDHATLLCSLLLGFGLDAYVAIGTLFAGTPWVWVVTLDSENEATFWESTTGSRCTLHQSTTTELLVDKVMRSKNNSQASNFKTISCLFNDCMFYANIQASNMTDTTDWDVSNPSKWKKIPETTLKSSSKFNEIAPTLLPSNTNSVLLASDIEIQLKILISETRMKKNLQTYWDNSLGKVFGQELAKYEMEACCGVNNLPGYFETAILKMIPGGFEFKGYPWQGNILYSHKIFELLMRDTVCEEIVMCQGNDVRLSIRVQVFVYVEDIISVRLMLACKFIP